MEITSRHKKKIKWSDAESKQLLESLRTHPQIVVKGKHFIFPSTSSSPDSASLVDSLPLTKGKRRERRACGVSLKKTDDNQKVDREIWNFHFFDICRSLSSLNPPEPWI